MNVGAAEIGYGISAGRKGEWTPEGAALTGGVAAGFTAAGFGLGAALGRLGGGTKLYHYTNADPESILKYGIQPGKWGKVFTTPEGGLSPVQAQIELALGANRGGVPQHLIEINVATLRRMGYDIPSPTRVLGTPSGAGGGWEVVFHHMLPPEALTIMR